MRISNFKILRNIFVVKSAMSLYVSNHTLLIFFCSAKNPDPEPQHEREPAFDRAGYLETRVSIAIMIRLLHNRTLDVPACVHAW